MRQYADGNVVERTKILLCKNLCHRAVKNQIAALKAHKARGIQRRKIAVVHGHEHTGPGSAAALKQIKKLDHTRPVEASGQFVQQQKRALLG